MNAAEERLKNLVERFEEEEVRRDECNEAMKMIMAEAKGEGYDVKALRTVLARRKLDREKVLEMDSIIDLYETALE